MVRRAFDSKDLRRGERLQEERKKIWKSRELFEKDTGIPSVTLKSWELLGADISTVALAEIAKRNGDVLYIITGKKQNSTPLPDAGVDAVITSAQREVLAACNDIVTAVAFVQSRALSASGQCEKIAPALKILREAIAEFPQEFRFSS